MRLSATGRRTETTRALGLVMAALLAAGCGPSFSVPKIPSVAANEGSGDTADFFFDPEHVALTQSGSIQVDFGIPALHYRGPLGCKGRTFAGDVTEHIDFVFRYSSQGAWLGWDNGDTRHFTRRPSIGHGTVTFAQHFSDGRHMRIVVHCPPPRAAGF